MENLTFKQYRFDATATDTGELVGWASVTGEVDRDGEVIAAGAFGNLPDLVTAGFAAVGHDWAGLPVGTIEEAVEDERGLKVRLAFHSHQAAQDARTVAVERLARGKSVGLSIGFRTLADHWDTVQGEPRRVIDAIELFEVSLVTVPANPLAQAAAVKSATFEDDIDAVLTAASSTAARARAVAELRRQQGKHLPDARKEGLRAVARELLAIADAEDRHDRLQAAIQRTESLRKHYSNERNPNPTRNP